MIGLILNEESTTNSFDDLNSVVNKLRLLTSDIIIPTSANNYKVTKNEFADQPNIQVIQHQAPTTNNRLLTDIYCASQLFENDVEFLTISTSDHAVNQEVLSIIAENQNSFASTTDQNFFTISHFTINQNDLISYINLDSFDLEAFFTQKLQCISITFAKSDIFDIAL